MQAKGEQTGGHVPQSAFNFAIGQRAKSEPRRCGNRKVILEDLNRKFPESYGLIIAEAGVHMFDLSAFRNQAVELRPENIILKTYVDSNSRARFDIPEDPRVFPVRLRTRSNSPGPVPCPE